MHTQSTSGANLSSEGTPAETISRHIRWQVLLVLAGILVLATLLGYSAFNITTVLIPDRGGVFREGIAGTPKHINPLRCDVTDTDYDLCALLFRGLTQVDKNGRVVADLAESWTISADGLIYDFVLKPDQYWDDGQPVTADDVLFTVSILQNPNVYSLPSLSSLWQTVKVERIDDRRVRFTLSEPFAPFLDYTGIGLLAKHVYETMDPLDLVNNFNNKPVGAGPLKVEHLAADHIRLVRNTFYSGPTPYLAALELRFYPDHPSLFGAFSNGEIEGISRVLPQDMPAAIAGKNLQLFSSAQPAYVHITFNLQNPNVQFFQDKRVRQALLYGLDRVALIADAVAGQGTIADSQLLPENWAYDPEVRKYAYDPGMAQMLLDQAGWKDSNGDGVRDLAGRPLQFVLHTNDDPTRIALVNMVAAQWGKIGVRAIPTPVTFAGLVTDLLLPRSFEAALFSWELVGDPDPYPLWHSTQAQGGGQNYAGWVNAEADAIMEQARATINEDERRALYYRFQDIFAEEAPALLLYHPVYTYGVSKNVFNVQIGALNHPSERFASFADWYMVTRRVPANQVPANAPPTPPSNTVP